MAVESVFVVFIIFMLFTLAIFVLCKKVRQNFRNYGFSSVYSTAVILTSQSHQPPGSTRTTNENSRSPRFTHRLSSPAIGTSILYSPGSQMKPCAHYPAMNTQCAHPYQSSFVQQMPHPSHMPYPPQTMYPPQDVQNSTQRSNSPQPIAPNPTCPSSQNMDVPPNYDEAIIILSKEPKKF